MAVIFKSQWLGLQLVIEFESFVICHFFHKSEVEQIQRFYTRFIFVQFDVSLYGLRVCLLLRNEFMNYSKEFYML